MRYSLYARIALAYIVLLLLLSGTVAWLTIRQFTRFALTLEQQINAPLAGNLAMILQSALLAGARGPQAREVASHIAAINPSLGLFVLDSHGRVVAAYKANCGTPTQVPLAPIKAFIAGHAALPVTGRMPCSGGNGTFSAAPVRLGGGDTGYLYVVLRGQPYHSEAAAMLRESYVFRALLLAGVATLVLALIIGLFWFFFLTRRFRMLAATVDAFSGGDHGIRVPAPREDEVGLLGRAFNEMADTIQAQIAALRESDELRRNLVANISHDFRTPLTSLRGYAERLLAQDDTLSADERKRSLETLVKSSDRLAHLVGQLSALSRLDAGQAQLQPAPFSLPELMQDIIVKFQPEARRLGVSLDIKGSRSLPAVAADIALIERAISNLVDNALRNTPSGGQVRVSLESTGHAVKVCVADNGAGIAREELPLVIKRFYRTRRSKSAHDDGSGLGLAIVHEIVSLHGATLDLASRPGQGTSACFALPITGSVGAAATLKAIPWP